MEKCAASDVHFLYAGAKVPSQSASQPIDLFREFGDAPELVFGDGLCPGESTLELDLLLLQRVARAHRSRGSRGGVSLIVIGNATTFLRSVRVCVFWNACESLCRCPYQITRV